MAISSIANRPVSSQMACGKMEVWTYTTTVNTYEVISTISASSLTGLFFTFAVTTNNLLFKIEVSKDGTNYYTVVEDFPAAAAASTSFGLQYAAQLVRVSVKPAAGGAHGSVSMIIVLSEILIPPDLSYAFGYESLTITNAVAVSLTQATYDAARTAHITVEANPIRVRWDGTAPTTTEGHLLQVGDTIELTFSADIYHFKAIATGGNATIRATYSR